MKIEEVRNFRNIEVFYYNDYSNPMSKNEIVDAFCYLIPAIQSEIVDCACKYSMNKNLKECKIALERIAALVGKYRFKTETGLQ